jgi:ribosomal protein S24E
MMETVKDIRNDLMKRREINMLVSSESNPGFEKMKNELALKFNITKENIVMNNIYSKFGSGDFLVEALIYDSIEHIKKFEPVKKVKKGGKK